MNLFDTVKAAVTPRMAAERYGLPIQQGSMTRCPFHADRTPSMKLNEDYFYCFGCGAHGDVIDLVAKLFGLGGYDAAKKLAADFGIAGQKPSILARLQRKTSQAEAERRCFRVLGDYLQILRAWKEHCAPQSPEDELDDRFVEACHMIEYVNDLLDVLMFAELKQRVKAVDMLLKDGTITALEQRLRRLEKEVQHRGEERAIA